MALSIFNKQKLAKEITLTLVIKIAVIYLLWLAFFSDPIDDNLTGPDVGNALFGHAVDDSVVSHDQQAVSRKEE